jgi:4-hydroxybenzoate polyprenyltransferase
VSIPAWADSGPARRAGFRVLGKGLAYVLHLRIGEWPIMAGHTVVGYLLAVGLAGAAHGVALGAALLGLLLWVVFLNGGTLAINSAFDQDEGDIGYLRRPPPPPPHLFAASLLLLILGQGLAFLLPIEFAWAYAACFLLSVLYSVPPFRLKSVAGADWVINMWGFGTLTPYAGWASTGLPMDRVGLLVLLGFCPLFAGLYPLTQIYQLEEDQRRGDRTLALRLGIRRSLDVALGCVLLAFGMMVAAGIAARWRWTGFDGLRWGGVLVALVSWLAVLLPWRARWSTRTPAQHQQAMYRALAAWAITDAMVLLGFAR